MPITKAVISEHICMKPNAASLSAYGYLPGTEWTCDECDAVFVLSTEGAASPYWVPLEPSEPEVEPQEESPTEGAS